MLSLSDFDYILPEEKIAQTPVSPRDHSKLLVLHRDSGIIQDKHFYDLADLLTSNDVLVLNDTKVFPARLAGLRESGNPIEILLEKEVSVTADTISFEVLSKPGLKLGQKISIPNTTVIGTCTAVHQYTRSVEFSMDRESFFSMLDTWAKTPIPPYIHWNEDDEGTLREKYQTVYAQKVGAVAAPTAGLHFTKELMKKLEAKGVQIEYVTLHVGAGTFLPVKTDDITNHTMHSEIFTLTEDTAQRLNQAKNDGKRIIAVGTTTIRVLETCAVQGQREKDKGKESLVFPRSGSTNIFIYPPYEFQFVDSVITNFHTPKSTLLMLIGALTSAPNTSVEFSTFDSSMIGKAYAHALMQNYRFYSFGDAMWIQ